MLVLLNAERKEYEREYARLVEEHISFPSIVTYVVFNEGWGQYEVCCFLGTLVI